MNRHFVFYGLVVASLLVAPLRSEARWLSPNTGRFQTRDTYEGNIEDPSALHKYLYAKDNPINRIDPLGLSDNTDFGNRVQEVITDDFVQQGTKKGVFRDGNRAIGTMVGVPSVGPLSIRPDLYQKDNKDNFFYEIKSATPTEIAKGLSKVARYNSYLNYYGPWRPGGARDYVFWKGTTGPLIKMDRNGLPLPGGSVAIVIPPVGGLMSYIKLDPKKLPRSVFDLIVADVLAFSELSIEGSVTAQAAEVAQFSSTLSSLATTSTASTQLGTVTTITVVVDEEEAVLTAEMGEP